MNKILISVFILGLLILTACNNLDPTKNIEFEKAEINGKNYCYSQQKTNCTLEIPLESIKVKQLITTFNNHDWCPVLDCFEEYNPNNTIYGIGFVKELNNKTFFISTSYALYNPSSNILTFSKPHQTATYYNNAINKFFTEPKLPQYRDSSKKINFGFFDNEIVIFFRSGSENGYPIEIRTKFKKNMFYDIVKNKI